METSTDYHSTTVNPALTVYRQTPFNARVTTDDGPGTPLDSMMPRSHTCEELVQNIKHNLARPFAEHLKIKLDSLFLRHERLCDDFVQSRGQYTNPFSLIFVELVCLLNTEILGCCLTPSNRVNLVLCFAHIDQGGWSLDYIAKSVTGLNDAGRPESKITLNEIFTRGSEADFWKYTGAVLHEMCHSYLDEFSKPSHDALLGNTGHDIPWQRITFMVETYFKDKVGKPINLGRERSMASEFAANGCTVPTMPIVQTLKAFCEEHNLRFGMVDNYLRTALRGSEMPRSYEGTSSENGEKPPELKEVRRRHWEAEDDTLAWEEDQNR